MSWLLYVHKENTKKTYDLSLNDSEENLGVYDIGWGIIIDRLPIIFMLCPGVYSVPNGANAGTAPEA